MSEFTRAIMPTLGNKQYWITRVQKHINTFYDQLEIDVDQMLQHVDVKNIKIKNDLRKIDQGFASLREHLLEEKEGKKDGRSKTRRNKA